jgi:hypothetical protein
MNVGDKVSPFTTEMPHRVTDARTINLIFRKPPFSSKLWKQITMLVDSHGTHVLQEIIAHLLLGDHSHCCLSFPESQTPRLGAPAIRNNTKSCLTRGKAIYAMLKVPSSCSTMPSSRS